MSPVSLVHTWQLPEPTRAAVRDLLDGAFDGGFSDEDWAHALGGVHALVRDGDALVGHGSVVRREMLHGGRSVRVGYVEAVAVRASHRRRGVGGAVMGALEDVVRGGYAFGALSASEDGVPFYAGRGWLRWRGRTFAMTPGGVVRTEEEDDGVFVLPAGGVPDLRGDLTCDWRDGDVW
ncbi:GNAT family N-acetyltransferase [Saccharothrix longispora]|uniref:GNAT family N-acetyltransferase n=1 Tax=Saccharothrix longispora TaxID=33920 RepID=UPI0028FD4BDD|nr:GNAT family N-acetyltransferase [Saccharothrix longispora]MBY8848914.1 GNAT family N-acetyltransferase [Saccharothrix sp. MB29]MDU0289408.1 GNAT family N-acetyltransferase [Saccharothrix longispora]